MIWRAKIYPIPLVTRAIAAGLISVRPEPEIPRKKPGYAPGYMGVTWSDIGRRAGVSKSMAYSVWLGVRASRKAEAIVMAIGEMGLPVKRQGKSPIGPVRRIGKRSTWGKIAQAVGMPRTSAYELYHRCGTSDLHCEQLRRAVAELGHPRRRGPRNAGGTRP